VINLKKLKHKLLLKSLKEESDFDLFEGDQMSSLTVNAFYSPNTMTIPGAIAQSPFNQFNRPKSMNLAGLGMVIGHEMTHGFDSNGAEYDEDGLPNNWWSNSSREEFESRVQCYKDQYSAFYIPELDDHVDGVASVTENTADNGGQKHAFRALKEFQKSDKYQKMVLPGKMGSFSEEQLFFLTHANMFCSHDTAESMKWERREEHAIAKFRVLGPNMNSAAFSEAFKCPLGSKMNPKNKCEVW